MIIEERNKFGFPVPPRNEQAVQYAAGVRERNKPACECPKCWQEEQLPGVIQLTKNWRNK